MTEIIKSYCLAFQRHEERSDCLLFIIKLQKSTLIVLSA